MEDFFGNKKKFLLVAILMVVTLIGRGVPRGQDGETYVNSIYTNNNVQVKHGDVDISDDEGLQRKYEDYKAGDLVTIKETAFSDAMDERWFSGLTVWPIAFLVNFVADFSGIGIGIIATALLIQLLIFLFLIKSQAASQHMQSVQPEMNRVQTKYAGKTGSHSRMQQVQEVQALYSEYKANPFETLPVTLMRFLVILGMYQATIRVCSMVTGSFQGINLAKAPIEGPNLDNYWRIVIFVLMVAFQLLPPEMPQWLQEHRKRKTHVKEKECAEPKKKGGNGTMGSMDMMVYMSIGMIVIFAINWPLDMSFYWLASSLTRAIQNIVIHEFSIRDQEDNRMKSYTGKSLEDVLKQAAEDEGVGVEELTYNVTGEISGFLGLDSKTTAAAYRRNDIREFMKAYPQTYFEGTHMKVSIDVVDDSEYLHASLGVENNATLIGKNRQTLQTINAVLKSISSSGFERRVNVLIDIDGYKGGKCRRVYSLTLRAAKSAQGTKAGATLGPIPADERKAIHNYLANMRHIATVSEGEGSQRRLKIVYSKDNT